MEKELEQENSDSNKTEKKNQKKSQKDMNGVIGGIIFGMMFVFIAYQLYRKLFEFPIGQILVYIIGFCAFVCFMVAVSCFFDYKESKKIEKLEEDAHREEKEFAEIDPDKRALRAEKMFRMNQKELMRYYDMNLAQTKFLSGLGIMMIIFGILIVVASLYMYTFFDSYDFEDAIRNAIALGGDSDTIGAITGSIASAYYGIPDDLCSHAMKFLDDYLLDIYMRFNEKVGVKNA